MSSRILYVDPIGGAAGDMLLSALIDVGAPLDAIRTSLEAVLPGRFRIDTEVVRRGGIRARLLVIEPAEGPSGAPSRPFSDLVHALDHAALPPGIDRRARSILDRLGQAEGRVHGKGLKELELHELGDDDTLLDVVSVAAALEALDVRDVLVAPIPLADPGPATLELLLGFAARGADHGETVTPTAAAIFAGLGTPSDRFPDMTIDGVGYGAGTRDPSGTPNVTRVVLGTTARAYGDGPWQRDLIVLESNLDDLSPELVADATQALLAGGALDVWTVPAQMKKGRQGVVLSALCDREMEAGLRKIFFEATSTFGVRAHDVRRSELDRHVVTVQVGDGTVRVKIGMLEGKVATVTPEHDDVAQVASASGRPVRAMYEEAVAAAQALRFAHTGDRDIEPG
jgi:uncharacterized protein (TIGR00299 family) protein